MLPLLAIEWGLATYSPQAISGLQRDLIYPTTAFGGNLGGRGLMAVRTGGVWQHLAAEGISGKGSGGRWVMSNSLP